jgi:hypothetical protein
MRVYNYKPDKAALAGIFLLAIAFVFAKSWWASGGLFSLFVVLLTTAGATKIGYDVFNPTPALRFDRTALWIRRTFGGVEEIPWKNIHSIGLYVFTMRYAGIIPVGKTEFIDIACEGGMFGARRYRVAATSMELPAGGVAEVVATLQAAHVAALGVAGVAMAGAGQTGWGVARAEPAAANASFDPDAAIARYLASKQDEQGAAPEVSAPTVQPDIPPRPDVPQRPVFGRKTA